jgi:SAM-dependent methyltransferase
VNDPDASIIDIGGGASTLVDDLIATGYHNLTVLDISAAALEVAKNRLGPAADRVRWIAADVTTVSLPPHSVDVWHDRAVFHFLIKPEDRDAYVRRLLHTVRPGGSVIIASFGPEGPLRCSGLPAVRYDSSSLQGVFGSSLQIVETLEELHHTPWGAAQQFIYFHGRVV